MQDTGSISDRGGSRDDGCKSNGTDSVYAAVHSRIIISIHRISDRR